MYNLIIFLRGSQAKYVLGFKDEGTLKAAHENIKERRKSESATYVTIKDDFGMLLEVISHDIESITIEDLRAIIRGNIERQIESKREEHAFMTRRKNDIELINLFPDQRVAGQFGVTQ